jgi:uncharacterized protein YuzE
MSTFKNQIVNTENAGGSILIGANGVVGINTVNHANQTKAMAAKKQKQLTHQATKNSAYDTSLDRDNRRAGRSSDLVSKEHKEMRTSSATAGNTGTEYKLLNMHLAGGLNLQNQNLIMGGGNSVTHAISKLSGEP